MNTLRESLGAALSFPRRRARDFVSPTARTYYRSVPLGTARALSGDNR